jgi:hypothetical protein
MIVANLATYPPRLNHLNNVIARLSPQVDRVNVVLNEYAEVPPALDRYRNVNPVLPSWDMKDVGKFLPDVRGASFVFLVDDDIHYPRDYVELSLTRLQELASVGPVVGGYHGTLYEKPSFSLRRLGRFLRYSPDKIAVYRRRYRFHEGLEHPIVVEQLGTGVAVLPGALMPSFDFMQGSQRFVDVRFARWCFENGIAPVCLAREAGWIEGEKLETSIFRTFTRKPQPEVAREIWQFAFKVRGRGLPPEALGFAKK